METTLIVLLIVFLLGGGGWGYSRWRRDYYLISAKRNTRVKSRRVPSFPNGGLSMATASLSGLEVLRLPDLLVLIKQTAERARSRHVLDPSAVMIPDEIMETKILYARARAWLLGMSPQRAEPRWRRPGDMEAAFFALYDALRSQIRPPFVANAKNSTPIGNHI